MVIEEPRRLEVLRSYGVLDRACDEALGRVTALAQLIFKAPMALVSLAEEQRWCFKSPRGLDVGETLRGQAFCDHALAMPRGGVLVTPDAARDARFASHPMVKGEPGVRFYAGAVLTSSEGANLGALCILDTQPREDLNEQERRTLSALADLVMKELEVGRARRRDDAKRQLLELAEEMSGVGRWRLEVASGAVSWSDGVYRIHGVDRSGFDPKLDSALDFYDAEDRQAVSDHIAAAVRDRQGFAFNLRIRRADGDRRQVMCKAACELDGGGAVVALVGVFQDVTEQADLLQRVSDDRERYRLLTQNATDVIATYRPDGTFTYLSPAVERLLGRASEDLVGRRTFEMIDPRDHARVLQEFTALAASGDRSTRIQYRALRADGGPLWLEAHPTPIRDAEGRLTGFQDVVRDVTARHLAEEQATVAAAQAQAALARAQESEARYRLLAENANDMISTSTMDSTVLFVTPAIHRALGYAPEEIVGRRTLDLTHPEDAPGVVAFFRRMVSAGPDAPVTAYQFRGRHKDGRWVWLEGRPRVQFDDDGRPVAFQDVVRDIEARKRAEEEALGAAKTAEAARAAAAGSEARYRLLAENATDMIARYALDGAIQYVSPACKDVLGFTPEEMLGRRTLELIHPDDIARVSAQFTANAVGPADAPPMQTEHRVVRKDGRVIWLEGRPRLVRDADGRPMEYHDVMRDVTERKVMEAELERARQGAEAAARAKTDFLANMSHELRTPLTSILGFTALAAEQKELAPLTRDYVRRVQNGSRALLSAVNDILDFSTLEAGQIVLREAPTDVLAACREAVELFTPQAAAKDLRLDTGAVGPAPATVMIDPERLRQLLLNLVGNAVKFTSAGSVTVCVGHSDGRLRIEVRDTGPGIAAEAIPRLFQRFSQVDGSSTRHHGGTGLGLAICKGLAERMGGSISVESEVGRGSVFRLDLPAPSVEAPPAEATRFGAASSRHLEGVRVLVVDDNPINRELARLILSGADADVSEAESGEDALGLLAQQPFDAVLLDLHMPGMDGPAVLQRLRQAPGLNDNIPVIAYTADPAPMSAGRPPLPGFEGWVGKPLNPPELLGVVRRAVAGDVREGAVARG